MSAPYWGALPQPKGVRSRRVSADYTHEFAQNDQRRSLDVERTRKANRASVQTTYTEAPTDTTFSPNSPTSAADYQGLAPRPASYRGFPQEQAFERYDRQDRRSNRVPDEFESISPAPPSVTDTIIRGPPTNYRDPYADEPYNYPHQSTSSQPVRKSAAQAESMGYGEHTTPQRDSQYGAPQPFVDGGLARTDSIASAQLQRTPTIGQNERRKKLADNRSPLQRLELTLDSMTKEEKRARVEAAEQRARARAAKRAAAEAAENQNPSPLSTPTQRQSHRPTAVESPTAATISRSVTLRDITSPKSSATQSVQPGQRVPEDQYYRQSQDGLRRSKTTAEHQPRQLPQPPIREEQRPRQLPQPPVREDQQPRQLPQPPIRDDQRRIHPQEASRPDDQRRYSSQAALQYPQASPDQWQPTSGGDIPKRNLSFRERDVWREAKPLDADSNQPSKGSSGFSLTRSGSNKLRKEPPADVWRRIRAEAERRLPPEPQPAQAQFDDPMGSPQGSPRGLPVGAQQQARNKELPPLPLAVNDQINVRPEAKKASTSAAETEIQAMQRRATEPIYAREERGLNAEYAPAAAIGRIIYEASQKNRGAFPQLNSAVKSLEDQTNHGLIAETQEPQQPQQPQESLEPPKLQQSQERLESRFASKNPEGLHSGDGLNNSSRWLNEWRKGTVGTLSGTLLDLSGDQPAGSMEKNNARLDREQGGHHRRISSITSRPRKAEAFDGEYDDTSGAPTRFKPQLYLKCGPLLRYCGLRYEQVPPRPRGPAAMQDREIWRGSVMIVTNDAQSSYDIAPTLRLFVQDIELLPPPPHQVNGELSPEYVDPIAGHPKLGRSGETLYVRPVDHLEEGRDLSHDESEEGLFEKSRSPPDEPLPHGLQDYPGSFASRRARANVDGEKLQKYKDVRGFRLHAEQGCTFWRFNIEVELREQQQRIAYRINRGPAMAFWVPGRGQAMNMMFYSCNGFSISVNPHEMSGPDPMWRDVLNSHQTQPFHAMIGGGDQIYNDCVAYDSPLFDQWLQITVPEKKLNAPFTFELQTELEHFYLERYCAWFSQGLFGLATSQIPMVNMYDDHDIFDGYGSYAHADMSSPVFSGLGWVAFKYYMLFQHQSIVTETENSEPSWILGEQPGPYIQEVSRSLYMSMGGKVALLAVDTRTERTEDVVLSEKTWDKITSRMYAEIRKGQVEHLLVLLGVPIAYPRLVWLENILTSKLMSPVKAIGKTGVLGKTLNNINDNYEILDDLNDHWTAKNHKRERTVIIEDLQDLAIDRSVRITILSGDVHLGAVGQFYSNPKLGLAKHNDPRYMPNIISSAIVNRPPADIVADLLNKRNKVHHFDKQTDEAMIPIFQNGVDGKPRNNNNLLPHRNWCSIRLWTPGSTPPPSPPMSDRGRSRSPGGGSLLRRLSSRRRRSTSQQPFDVSRESVRGPRPPISGGGGLFKNFGRRNSVDQQRPVGGGVTRTMSLGRGESAQQSADMAYYGQHGSQSRFDESNMSGQWSGEFDGGYADHRAQGQPRPSGLRGGGGSDYDEFSAGDEAYFTSQAPRRAQTVNYHAGGPSGHEVEDPAAVRPYHRTPTGLSPKDMKQADRLEVNLEGALDIALNMEVNAKDPTGITVPYRILVPKLFYEYSSQDDLFQAAEPTGIKKFLSFRKKPKGPAAGPELEPEPEPTDEMGYDDDEVDDERY
ncbi:hypothetical protein M441DRAFT_27244 [Trichoderma asperellum CBS 433.97]|uniref:PhoD-like phosphatase domain-containing protein n=1 Tax=Trichoderma asperellum (strain ATCC 204424 / CBS 433.97 / NBRC 101777) TaxID=1042311 RepID=A0A2T3Z7B7_TRIA4|nr:hypothetical protein M441DRAFT_27244 [Trichoderma asperellum CBS 433.97]PTB40688.1 hypothetical protein M441DRAFT_27244 [Trichoderma asperellum CBS 433.97]